MICEMQALIDYMNQEPQKSIWLKQTGHFYTSEDADYSCSHNLNTVEAFKDWFWVYMGSNEAQKYAELNKNVTTPTPESDDNNKSFIIKPNILLIGVIILFLYMILS